MLTKNVIEAHFPAAGAFDLAQAYGRLAEAAQLRSFEAFERFYEIGSAQDLRDLETHLVSSSEEEKKGNPGAPLTAAANTRRAFGGVEKGSLNIVEQRVGNLLYGRRKAAWL